MADKATAYPPPPPHPWKALIIIKSKLEKGLIQKYILCIVQFANNLPTFI